MANANLERISVKTKSIQTFVLPDLPKLPPWFVRQFHLEEWEGEMERWRQNAQEGIRAALQAVQSKTE